MDFIKVLELEVIFYFITTLAVLIAQRTIDTTISNKMNVARIGECFLLVFVSNLISMYSIFDYYVNHS
jgi:hypothetical protein